MYELAFVRLNLREAFNTPTQTLVRLFNMFNLKRTIVSLSV